MDFDKEEWEEAATSELESQQSGIKFEEEARTKSRTTTQKRRLSLHGKKSEDGLFTIREKSQAENVLPGLHKTLSFRVENELVQKHAIGGPISKFTSVKYHVEDPAVIAKDFGSSLLLGLDEAQYKYNIGLYGRNVQLKPPGQLWKKLFMYSFGGFGALLLGGGILCIVSWKPLGEPAPAIANLVLGLILLAIFVLQALFNFFQDYSSSRIMDLIHGMIPSDTLCIRDGQAIIVNSRDLVPGDIVKFDAGAKIPADIRIFEATPELAFDRSILTGESLPVPASAASDVPNSNYLETSCIGMQGTFVVTGSGAGIVVAIGDETIFGTIAKMTSRPKKGLSPMQWEILRFVIFTVSVIVTLIVLVVVLWAAWLRKDHNGWINVPALIVDIVSVAVAFIPEGLPIALTTCLIITASKMRLSGILCKSLSVVETLGSVSTLCFDKTGTLTKNKMQVAEVAVGLEKCEVTQLKDKFISEDMSATHLVTIGLACNAAARLPDGKLVGNATDQAIFRFAEGYVAKKWTEQGWTPTFLLDFNSKDKYMAMLGICDGARCSWENVGLDVAAGDESKYELLMVKGAPDILMKNCEYWLQPNGVAKKLDRVFERSVYNMHRTWSASGKRVILLASKLVLRNNLDFEDRNATTQTLRTELTGGLTYVGMVAIEDPPRGGMHGVISKLREAGIRTVMITGDFELTGIAIAKQVGIISMECDGILELSAEAQRVNDAEVTRALSISGPQIPGLSSTEWSTLVRYSELVFTRTTPEQKLLIIKQLREHGFTTGMIGDGINDSPSLKEADVGISLIGASDIAKEASDLILLGGDEDEDELFLAVVEALNFGRLVFENLRKTLGYLLPAGTYSELWPVLLNVIFGMPQMLSSFLMIMICCVTDCSAAIILAFEKNERNLLSKKPRSITKEKLVDWKLLLHSYFTIGTFYTFTSMLLGFINLKRKGFAFSDFSMSYGSYEDLPGVTNAINMSSSIYFNNLVIMQFFNLIAMRTRYLSMFQHSPFKNKFIFIVVPFALAVTFLLNYIPAIQNAMGTSQVPVEYYFISLGFGACVLIYDELRKFFNRKYPTGFMAKIAW